MDTLQKAINSLEETLEKGRKMPIGTISKGYKKVAEGKWVKVKEQQKKEPVKPVDKTETPEFKKWFGDSKVVDKNGKPLVVYKGMMKNDWRTGKEIQEINSPSGNWAGFFSDSKDVAKSFEKTFSTMGESHTIEVYVKIEKPFVVDAQGKPAKEFMIDNTVFGKEPKNKEIANAVNSGVYDGVIIKNTKDEGTIILPLKPNQIKSASKNIGDFDLNSNNMYKAK